MRYTGAISSLGKLFGRSTIYGRNGEHDTPYMTRIWLGPLRLHIFYRGDRDEDCHDHPWDFWTFPFTSYVEEVIDPYFAEKLQNSDALAFVKLTSRIPITYLRVVKAWRFHHRSALYCHRVLGRYSGKGIDSVPAINDRKIVTLVWRTGVYRKWGFLKNRNGKWCWVPHKEYVFGSGKDAPCSDD